MESTKYDTKGWEKRLDKALLKAVIEKITDFMLIFQLFEIALVFILIKCLSLFWQI